MTIPTLVLFPVIVWAYFRLARREELQMIEEFGDRYRRYQEEVPIFHRGEGSLRGLNPRAAVKP